jgi:hypothetical protein
MILELKILPIGEPNLSLRPSGILWIISKDLFSKSTGP